VVVGVAVLVAVAVTVGVGDNVIVGTSVFVGTGVCVGAGVAVSVAVAVGLGYKAPSSHGTTQLPAKSSPATAAKPPNTITTINPIFLALRRVSSVVILPSSRYHIRDTISEKIITTEAFSFPNCLLL